MVDGMIAGEAAKSRKSAAELLAAFDAAAEKAGILHETILEKCLTLEIPDLLVEYARLRDLTILPASSDQWYAESIMFGSGRPTMILPENPKRRPFQLGTVAVAWDFSRAAARAVSDALPILELAKKVRIVTVVNEKALDTKRSGEELAKNLARHGIDVVLDKVDAKGDSIGAVLESYTSVAGCGPAGDGGIWAYEVAGVRAWRRDPEPAVEAAAADPVLALRGVAEERPPGRVSEDGATLILRDGAAAPARGEDGLRRHRPHETFLKHESPVHP